MPARVCVSAVRHEPATCRGANVDGTQDGDGWKMVHRISLHCSDHGAIVKALEINQSPWAGKKAGDRSRSGADG